MTEERPKRTIDLADMAQSDGILVPWPTGILWTNQVGGTGCAYPVIEGFYLPVDLLRNELSREARRAGLEEFYNVPYNEHRPLIAEFLERNVVDVVPLTEAEAEHQVLHAAWLWCKIVAAPQGAIYKPFANEKVILTWPNSD